MPVQDLTTPALLVDLDALAANVALMATRWPGERLRPHVKAFKSTEMAHELATLGGHRSFCCATPREVRGMAAAGLGHDLLLANEVADWRVLRSMRSDEARITVAVDSVETIDAAARAGVEEVLVDVNVGLPRCGCRPEQAGELADYARKQRLEVRGVMGYEGHLMLAMDDRAGKVADAMVLLAKAHADVGGDVVSGGGTGTWDLNDTVTELQAGSYTLMDTAYTEAGSPFRQALFLLMTVISVNRADGYAVADGGLKALGMDHGNPSLAEGPVWYCSDEHLTFGIDPAGPPPVVGDRIRVLPAHVDPTVALHERLHVVRGDDVIDVWPVDLRGW